MQMSESILDQPIQEVRVGGPGPAPDFIIFSLGVEFIHRVRVWISSILESGSGFIKQVRV